MTKLHWLLLCATIIALIWWRIRAILDTPPDDPMACGLCGGTGSITYTVRTTITGTRIFKTRRCTRCDGSGLA